MRKMVVHICSFSGGLDDLPKKNIGAIRGRFCCNCL